jgi:cytidylate kinase
VSDIITIDGPVSSGKSSVAHMFARKIGYQFIDTGAIYRIFSIYVLDNKISLEDDQKLVEVFDKIKVEFKDTDGKHLVFADGVDVSDRLHSPEVTAIVADVSPKKEVRLVANKLQREVGSSQDTVMTGRDIGSKIFPDAKLKFYITASPEVRAKRRHDQLVKTDPSITMDEVLESIKERDRKDTDREFGKMVIPDGAIVIDTSNLTIDQSVDKMVHYYNKNHDKI